MKLTAILLITFFQTLLSHSQSFYKENPSSGKTVTAMNDSFNHPTDADWEIHHVQLAGIIMPAPTPASGKWVKVFALLVLLVNLVVTYFKRKKEFLPLKSVLINNLELFYIFIQLLSAACLISDICQTIIWPWLS
jgi:hypothetical protein